MSQVTQQVGGSQAGKARPPDASHGLLPLVFESTGEPWCQAEGDMGDSSGGGSPGRWGTARMGRWRLMNGVWEGSAWPGRVSSHPPWRLTGERGELPWVPQGRAQGLSAWRPSVPWSPFLPLGEVAASFGSTGTYSGCMVTMGSLGSSWEVTGLRERSGRETAAYGGCTDVESSLALGEMVSTWRKQPGRTKEGER